MARPGAARQLPRLVALAALGVCGTVPLRRAHRAARRAPTSATAREAGRLKFSINIYEPNAPAGSTLAEAAAAAMHGRTKGPGPGYSVHRIATFQWLIGDVDSLQGVIDRVRVPGTPPVVQTVPPDVQDLTICEQRDFVPLDHIYPNVAPVAGTVVAALRAGIDVLSEYNFVTERRCLKRIASLSHALCTDLQMVNGTIFARDVPKHRCVNYGSVGHQFHRLCTRPATDARPSEFFHLTSLRCGPHALLVASEVDGHTPQGEGIELKIGKLGGLSTWTQCLFADVSIVVRGTSREDSNGCQCVQRVNTFHVDRMLSEEAKERAMAFFARVLTQLRRSMHEGRVYRLQREQRNIVCFELPEETEPLITEAEIDWLKARVPRAERPSGVASAPMPRAAQTRSGSASALSKTREASAPDAPPAGAAALPVGTRDGGGGAGTLVTRRQRRRAAARPRATGE